MKRALILAVAFVLCGGSRAWPQDVPSEAQVEAALEKGRAYLRQVASPDPGVNALMCMTLLKSGDAPDSPAVKPRLDAIVQRVQGDVYTPTSVGMSTEIYEAGVALMALANGEPEKHQREIGAVARFIIERQRATGAWDYPALHHSDGDTSVTQYAVLGLWEANRHGVEVPLRVWDRVALWHIRYQMRDGGFAYKPVLQENNQASTHTMTAAGSGSLYVARLHLFPAAGGLAPDVEEKKALLAEAKRRRPKYGFLHPVEPGKEEKAPKPGGAEKPTVGDNVVTVTQAAIDTSLSKSSRWLQTNWTVTPQTVWAMYYLYCIERYGALTGSPTIGDSNWYDEGASALLASQAGDGSWGDSSGKQASTCFGVLFLSKATQKLVEVPVTRKRRTFLGTGLLQGGRGLPENLDQLKVDAGGVGVKKLKGPVADLLAELEKAGSEHIESAQAGIVEQVLLDKPEELIGQKDRLKRLATDSRPEVRRTAFWALARTDDLRLAPLLIKGLEDAEADCMLEAHQGLIFLSRKAQEPELPEELTPELRDRLIEQWKAWYLSVRAYDERDDLTPAPGKREPQRGARK